MCGIIGIASHKIISNTSWFQIAKDLIHHRGPDDCGEWRSSNGKVLMGHRRLSILDLSHSGHQPMQSFSKDFVIIFNGEIYNFKDIRANLIQKGYSFKSQTDTEVLLAAYEIWGVDCLSRFNGMFAFSIYDVRNQVMFLARDRAGEKPLFYHLADGVLHFGSELKTLLADPALPRKICYDALDCYLTMGYVPGERCILNGYNKLPPAHAMLFNLGTGKAKIWRYWEPPNIDDNYGKYLDEIALLDELELLLENSVRLQLQADVPVGVLLSGGVDSSLVTAMAARVSNDVRTFTIGFPGHKSFDETAYARTVASHFGTHHTELVVEPARIDLLPILAHQFDEPIADSSMIPTFLVSKMVKQQCSVALGGDGADELFGGYNHHNRFIHMQRWAERIPRLLRIITAKGVENAFPLGVKGRNWLQGFADNFNISSGLPIIIPHFDLLARCKLMRQHENWRPSAEEIFKTLIPSGADILQRSTRMDFNNYLAEDILVKVDRASMLNSLEIRAPFLDHHLIEFAYGRIPSRLKATGYEKKILLKRLAKRELPNNFDLKRKQGFSIPLSDWMKKGEFRTLFYDVLLSDRCVFDQQTIIKLFKLQDRGVNNSERLFALTVFQLWADNYKIEF